MFCPNCGNQDQSGVNFCKRCGTNLVIVADALTGKLIRREDEESARKRAVLDEVLKDALVRRRRMLSVGITSSFVGIGLMVMLAAMEGVHNAAPGVIPLMIGLGLIVSALFIYRPGAIPHIPGQAEIPREGLVTGPQSPMGQRDRPPESITVETTRRLEGSPPPRILE
jgi:hypothetical protein